MAGSMGLVERSLARQKFDIGPLSQEELAGVFRRIENVLTPIGREMMVDVEEIIGLTDNFGHRLNVLVAHSLEEARGGVSMLLTETTNPIGYITGGLEGIYLNLELNGLISWGITTFVMGIEENSYVEAKGRKSLFSTKEKVALWERLAPDLSVLFVVPRRPETVPVGEYYDWIAQYLGLYKNEQVIYLGSSDDPVETIWARQTRATTPRNCLNVNLGCPPLHTSELMARWLD